MSIATTYVSEPAVDQREQSHLQAPSNNAGGETVKPAPFYLPGGLEKGQNITLTVEMSMIQPGSLFEPAFCLSLTSLLCIESLCSSRWQRILT